MIPENLCYFKGSLNTLDGAATKLSCSKDHVIGLIDDGELEYINLARKGSKHREIRLSDEQLELFAKKRSRKETQATPSPRKAKSPKSSSTPEAPAKGSFADRYRAKKGG